jgi:hypothetical protein
MISNACTRIDIGASAGSEPSGAWVKRKPFNIAPNGLGWLPAARRAR